MINNLTQEIISNHFEISDSELLKMIEIWKYFNKEDDPIPGTTKFSIIPNEKIGEISVYTFAHLVKFSVTDKLLFLEKFSIKTEVLLTERMSEWLYEHFNKNFLDK